MGHYRVDFEALPWDMPMAGLRFKAGERAGRRLRLVEYTKEMKPHWCDKGHIGYILEGQFEIRFEREVAILYPGDGVFIPPGTEHRHMAKVLSDVVRAVFVEDA